MIVIGNSFPGFPKRRKCPDVFSADEIDRLDDGILAGKSRKQLETLRQKLEDTSEWLETGDCEIDSPEWKTWERRMDKLDSLMDRVDDLFAQEDGVETD